MTASPPLDLTGFGAAAGIGPSDTLNSVTATVNGWNSDPGMGPLGYELRDSHGVLIGSGTGTASTSPAHVDTVTFPPPSWSELHWLHLRVTASGTVPGAQAFVDYASLSVSWLPSGIPFAAPVTAAVTAVAAAPDANGPRGRVQADITVSVGATASRAQATAGLVMPDGTITWPTAGDGITAGAVITRELLGTRAT